MNASPCESQERLVFAGIDEAGYGPVLGPLCVGVCAFSVPAPLATEAFENDSTHLAGHLDFWTLLAAALTEDARTSDRRTVVCDSKELHNPNRLRPLEETVLTLLAARTGQLPATFGALLDEVSFTPASRLAALQPWYAGEALAETLPVEALREKCALRGETVATCLAQLDVRLEGIRVEPVEVPTFNELLREVATKADAELAVIAPLLSKLWERFPNCRVVVDRLGARDYYRPMLEARFPRLNVRTLAEAQPLPAALARKATKSKKKKANAKPEGPPRYSRYRVEGPASTELDVTFTTGGERVSMPVAVASLFAKYVREGCMRALNRYWQARLPGLRATKGYRPDGERFVAEIEAALGSEAVEPVRPQLVRDK